MGELFKRIKKLAKKREVILLDESGEDAVVVMPFDKYEGLVGDLDFEFEEEAEDAFDFDDNFLAGEDKNDFFADLPKEEKSAVTDEDRELMKKVNEDIAKWRAEQQKTAAENALQASANKEVGKEADDTLGDSGSVLTEEERYYLEPLE